MSTANGEVRIQDLPNTNITTNTDIFVLVRASGDLANTLIISTNDFVHSITSVYSIPTLKANTPANSSALTIQAPAMFFDNSYLYIVTSNNFVRRTALSSF